MNMNPVLPAAVPFSGMNAMAPNTSLTTTPLPDSAARFASPDARYARSDHVVNTTKAAVPTTIHTRRMRFHNADLFSDPRFQFELRRSILQDGAEFFRLCPARYRSQTSRYANCL